MSTRVAIVANARVGAELTGGTQDASRVFSLLTRNDLGCCDARRSKLLANCESRIAFQQTLLGSLEQWDPKDQLVVYFSGHGEVRNGRYVLLFGIEPTTILPFDALMADLQACSVKRAILILDACFSGAVVAPGEKAPTSTDPIAPELADEIPKGIAMLASSRPREKSYELPDGSASLFTSLLAASIETGLSGRRTPAGLISVGDSIDYINRHLRSEDFAHVPQAPVYGIHGADRDIWLARNPSGDSDQIDSTTTTEATDVTTPRSLEELRFLHEITAASRRPCPGATVDDLDWDLLKQYAERTGTTISTDRSEAARALGLRSTIAPDDLTTAAVLCFARHPDQFIPQARCVLVVGDRGDQFFERIDVTGPLPTQCATIMHRLARHLEHVAPSIEQASLRDFAIREAISNALAHRDYEHTSHIRVSLKQNAIEIVNPGTFGHDRGWADMISSSHESTPRDAAIAWYMTNLLAFEGVGRGFEVYRNYTRRFGADAIRGRVDPLTSMVTVQVELAPGATMANSGTDEQDPSVTIAHDPPTTDIGRTRHQDEPTHPSPTFPERIGRYRVQRLIGQGGMGSVVEATDERLGRTVAIKIVSSRYLSGHAMDRFTREAQTVARLSHPNIVAVYDVGQQDDFAYIVMEHVRGGELGSVLDRQEHRRFSIERAVTITTQVAQALQYAHEQGIIHRDVKPSNIIVDDHGTAKLMDFGIAKSLQQRDVNVTMTAAVLGTPAYMSPEQASDTTSVGLRTDIFSLGVVLYEMLTGRRPFLGESIVDVIRALRENEPRPVRSLNPDVPPGLQVICAKCLRKKEEDRYASMHHLIEDLQRFESNEPVSVAPRPFGPVRALSRMLSAATNLFSR